VKVVQTTADQQVRLVDVADPQAQGEWVVVKIVSAPMCTEYKAYKAGREMTSMGHEAAGEVVEVDQSSLVKAGDRVAVMPQTSCGVCDLCLAGEYIHCQQAPKPDELGIYQHGTGTYAQYVIKQDRFLVPLPDAISFDHGSMACCGLGPTFGAMQRMNVGSGETVMVTGIGPVGLGAIVNAMHRRARAIAVETIPYRRELAVRLGAMAAVDPTADGAHEQVMELTGGRGVDAAVDCSGVGAAQRFALDCLRRRGRLAFVGQGGEVPLYTSRDMISRGLELYGAWHYNRADASRLLGVIADSGELLDRQITHRMPMSSAQEAFELQITGETGKVILHPWEE
jgi:L-iditol 2-dehydrogenase